MSFITDEVRLRRVRFAYSLAGLVFLALAIALDTAEVHALPDRVTLAWGDSADYPITNSGYQGNSSGQTTVAWIDDHRVVFTSHGPLLASGEPRRSGSNDLYIWNTRSGRVEKHAESVSGFCYADGFIRYWSSIENGKIVEHSGRIGEEQKRVYAVDDFPPRRGWRLNSLTCHRYRREEQPTAEGVFFYPLKEGDGHLGSGSSAGSNFTVYLPHGSAEYQRLSVPTRTVVVGYSQLAGAYVLKEWPPFLRLDSTVNMRLWLFGASNVRLEPLVIPAGPWLRGSLAFVRPAPKGIVFTSHAAGRPDLDGRPTTGAGGVYLVATGTGRTTRVMSGYPYSASITADGCKVIVSMASRAMASQPAVVKFVDLCRGGR